MGQDSDAAEVKSEFESNEFVFICGYGRVGKMVCEMLDKMLVKYIVLDNSPQKAFEARNKGLPVFFGMIY
jgi:voltage-gated potassium channel Kch